MEQTEIAVYDADGNMRDMLSIMADLGCDCRPYDRTARPCTRLDLHSASAARCEHIVAAWN